MATEPSRLEANRLYWETDSSVGHIADELGVSRRALYELLEPLPAEGTCPACGSPLLFANRLARAAGEALCGTCGATQRLSPTARHGAAPAQGAATPRADGPAARQRGARADNGGAPDDATDAAPANGADGNGAPPRPDRTPPPRHGRFDGEDATSGRADSTLDRAAHALGLSGEREAAHAAARLVRVFGFALAGVLTGMAVVSILRRRR